MNEISRRMSTFYIVVIIVTSYETFCITVPPSGYCSARYWSMKIFHGTNFFKLSMGSLHIMIVLHETKNEFEYGASPIDIRCGIHHRTRRRRSGFDTPPRATRWVFNQIGSYFFVCVYMTWATWWIFQNCEISNSVLWPYAAHFFSSYRLLIFSIDTMAWYVLTAKIWEKSDNFKVWKSVTKFQKYW